MKTKTNHFTITRLTSGVRQRASILIAALFCFAFLSSFASAQLSGPKTIPGDYATITAAVTDLNSQGVGAGGVTFNVAAGYTETVSATIALTATGTASNQIIFQKDPSTVGANPLITAYTGGTGTPGSALQDGIWRLAGSDWVTIDGIDLIDNPANTTNPSTMEYGYALYKASATDGAQNDTIKNCTITLNRINNAAGSAPAVDGSRGIDVTNAVPGAATTPLTVTAASGSNSNNKFYSNTIQNCNIGIALIGFADVSPFANADTGNDVGGASAATGNQILNFGGGAVTNPAAGIRTLAQYNENISFNTINNNNGAGVNHATTLRGIFNNTATSASATINNNTVTVKSGGTTSILTAIENVAGATAASNTISINNNTITGCTYTTATSGAFTGITNSASAATVNINGNQLTNNATNATSGTTNLVQNTGAATTAVNINSNNINGWTFNAVTSGAFNAVTNSGGAATAAFSMSTNNIQSIVHSLAGSSAHTYLINTAATLSQNISTNTFTNLIVNTTGGVTFISNSVSAPAAGFKTINSNSIVTGFNKTGAGGTVALYTDGASTTATAGIQNNNNNFSNLTVTGATTVTGWFNNDGTGGTPTKTITGNTFNNWTCGSSAVNVLQSNFGNTNTYSNNTITNITGTGAITGLLIGSSGTVTTLNMASNTITGLSSTGTGGTVIGLSDAYPGTANITSNTINTLSSTGASSTCTGMQVTGGTTVTVSGNTINTIAGSGVTSPVVNGLSVSSGTTVNVSKNKIYDLAESGAISTTSPAINGMLFSGGTTVNAFNNLVGDLRTPAASLTDAIRGMSVTSATASTTYNLSFNTIYLNATSTGTNFGTTGIFHTTSATATTATLNLRDNIIDNTSTPNGTGLTVAYRRSSAALTNYGSVSNNNDFYAGTPGASRLIFFDGTNSDQTLGAYKTRVSPRDGNSISENPPFLSTTGSSANFLHINTATPTQLESGGIPVSGITDDFDGDARNGSTPDVGADEFAGIALDLTPPTISYTPLSNTNSTANRTLTATITDASGVATGGLAPRIYFKKSTDASYVSTQCSGSSPTYTCTIDNSLVGGGSVALNDIIQYFVVAQDTAGNVGANPSAGFAATDVNNVTTPPTSPNSYTIIGSISGNFNVGVGQTYPTITDAVNDLNNKVVTGAVTFLLTDSSYSSGAGNSPNVLDVFPLTINANSGSSATNTITIKPAPGVVAAITASVASGALLTVKASFVTIDGSNSGGTDRSLTITNTGATTPSVIVFGSTGTTPVTDDTLKNCVIINGINTSSAVVVSDATTVGAAGFFNNITIRNNNVQKAFRGILAVATVSGTNGSGTLITQNDLNTAGANSIRLNPIAAQGTNGVTITNNNMGNISDANAEIPLGILLATGVDNAVVTGNTISSIVTTNTTSTASVEGILVSAGAATTSINVSNNTISTLTSSGTAAGNFYALGSFSPNCTISNNNISGLTNSAASVTMWGIALAGASNSTVSGNSVTSMSSTNTGSGGTPFGINLQGAITNCNVTGNTVSNIATLGSSTTPTGILLSGTLDGITVQKNNISGVINNNTGTWGAWGMRLNGGNNHVVKNNFVSNVTQNMTGGGAFSTSFGIFGIQVDTGTGHKVYNNSVNLFGLMPGTAASSLLTAAFSVVSTTSTGMDVRNNIFANNITGGTTAIAHVSIYLPSGGTSAMNLTDNKNSYYFGTDAARQGTGQAGTTAGTNFFTTLAALKAYSSTLSAAGTNDNASIASTAAVPYTTATNLHLVPAAPEVDTGVTIASVTDDIDGDTRPQLAAYDIGADEVPNSAPTISAAAGVTRQQGSAASNSTIATVNDVNTGAGSVVVTVTSANPSNGVTVSNIVNTNGTVTADIVASCNATNATFTLQASDGSLTSTDTLSVSVTPDTVPTLTYNNGMVAFGGSTTINPATGPSDNGSVSTIAVQSMGTYTGTISVDNTTGVVSISNAAPTGTHTITIRATDNCGLTTDATFTLTVPDTAPSIAAAAGVTRQQGSPSSNSTIATVNDTESGPGGVVVTVISPNPSNGVTISNIFNTGGTVTADVVASCNATNATFTLQASDGSLTSTDTLSVTVTADTAPALTYSNDSVAYNGSTTINPATGPSDNGSVSTIAVQSQGTYTGTISVDNAGVVSISNAKPAGTHTITIRSTDNCGLTTDSTFTLTVGAASSNADLSNLVLSDGTLTPAFSSANTSYTASVPNSTSSMTVTPTAADANATIQVQVNGGGYATVPSGSPSGSLALNVGANTIDVKVAAQDETRPGGIRAPATIKIYTVTVTRAAAASNNADLSDLTATAGPLSPAFAPNTLAYTVNTPFTTTSTTVTPTASDAGATITVNGNPVASGSQSASIPLNVGNNTITIIVTAADTTTTKTYTINVIRGAQVVVSGSTGADGSYATLQAAFAALNANATQGGNTITVSITGDTTETGTAVLNQPSVSSWTSLAVTPSGARTVSGSLAAPLIDLNGADNVIINGFNSAGNSLTISNASIASTAGTSTVRFIEGATNNTVQNCTILGSSTASTATAGGNVLFSTSTVAGGNSTNTVSNNDIGPAGANLPTKGIMGLGTAANLNSGNIINNNNVFDYFNATTSVSGINVQANNTTWTISNNRIYQTGARVFTATAQRYAGITLNNTGSFSITGNTIGFASAAGTGTTTISGSTNTFRGIDAASASTTVATSIQGNTISGISQTTATTGSGTTTGFVAIMLGSTDGLFNVGDVTGNNVGSLTGASTISVTSSAGTGIVYGIFNFSFVGTNISNNNIGSISIGGSGTTNGFRGILVNTSSAAAALATVNGNTITDISNTQVGNYAMYGIQISLPPTSMTGNTVRNFTGNANGAVVVMGGIGISNGSSTIPSTISQNTVHSLNNTVTGGAAGALYVIDLTLPTQANIVERNFVHSCNVTTTFTTYQLWGIVMRGTTATLKNNMVRLGIDSTGASITTPYSIIGMRDIAATGASSSYYYNSVYIGGSGVLAGGSNTFALNSNVITLAHTYVNNIFHNARSNAVAGGTAHVAITVAGTTANPAGLTSNYNDLFASGTDGVVGVFNATIQPTLAAWRTATGQDANSISANPQFVNPTGTAATVNLHINCASPADGSGTPVAGITTDFDNETRNATTPDIGADEINLTAPTPVSAVSRKVHGAAGPFDINLPFAGPAGVESRSGGATGVYQVVVTFGSNVNVSGAVVTAGTGSVSLVSGSGSNTITVDLTGVANAQYLTVKLLCVDDTVNLGSVSVTMGVLAADATADGSVNGTDVSQVKLDVGNTVDGTTFRSDVDANGNINASDVSLTKLKSGTALPQ